ncbi:MAG: ClpXP protease specificity-enhancing factor [Gammaproteobacteria bacterium]
MQLMSSNRPYLIRALYDWILDNNMTPQLLVDATFEGIRVPERHVNDGKIVLNITPGAIRDLDIGNEWVLFSARFDGNAFAIQIPINAVAAIYARENGQGMIFPEETHNDVTSEANKTTVSKPQLRVIK